ncbi:MAG: hypothetical protein LBR72_06640 [Oscillospiraceae bacterium]|nr:hypothetical protein [Oscillospiraceae bacterium]
MAKIAPITLPGRQSQAYSILSLIAVSGELAANQIHRLPGGRGYKIKLIKSLKQKKLIHTYYRDKLRGYRLTSSAKEMLLDSYSERFTFPLSGNTDTNILKSEITRRLRLHSIAEATVTMQNAGLSVFRDEKADVFRPDGGTLPALTTPAFYNSREIKGLGSESVKIKGARTVGVLLTASEAFVVYNTGDSLLKWEYKSEMRTKALMKAVLCRERLRYRPENIRAMMLGGSMEQAYQLLTSTGGGKRNYFVLDGNYDSFVYLTNDRNGEILLRLLCDKEKTMALNRILSENLYARDGGLLVENDAVDENGEPVLFAHDCDMPRITRFDAALRRYGKSGTVICCDFQADALRRFCGENVRFQTIDMRKLEGRFFP